MLIRTIEEKGKKMMMQKRDEKISRVLSLWERGRIG